LTCYFEGIISFAILLNDQVSMPIDVFEYPRHGREEVSFYFFYNDVDETKISREKSVAHHILFHKAIFISFDTVFLSFDIENEVEKY